jgi:hypothetical protein
MEYSYDKSWDAFEEIFNAKLGIKESWNKIIDFHEAIKPKSYWSLLRELDVEAEQEDIRDWMEQIVENSPLPKSVVALWVGITQLWDEETQKDYYAIYLTGASTYDAEDIDWAAKPKYEPEENFGIVQVLTQLTQIISDDQTDFSYLDWILPISYVAFSIDEIIRSNSLEKKIFLKGKNLLHVTTGYDEGDFVNLTPIA